MKIMNTALIVLLLLTVGAFAFGGLFEGIFPAQKSSPVAEDFVGPEQPNIWNILGLSTLGELKNQQEKLEVITATTEIVAKEYTEKIGKAQVVYDRLIGTIDNPGLLGSGLVALLSIYGTALYKKNTMYSEAEVAEIKNELTKAKEA